MQESLRTVVRNVPGLEWAGVAETATGALAAFESHQPDLVILDLVLGAGSGLGVLRAIKQQQPACRVVVFTGHDGAMLRTRCLAAGADYFFSKIHEHRDLVRQLHAFGAEAPRFASGQPNGAVVPPLPGARPMQGRGETGVVREMFSPQSGPGPGGRFEPSTGCIPATEHPSNTL